MRLLPAIVLVPAAGLAAVLAAPGLAPLWMVLIGFGQSGALGLALALPIQRGGDAPTVASLTAMALCVGYLVAAAGPWLLGAVHDASGDWTVPLVVLIAITLAELVPGLPAARARTIARVMDTQVGIVGAGPAGLLLAHLLARGIDSRRAGGALARVRRAPGARGVLEQGTVDVLTETGVADRLHREGMVHHGLELRFGGGGHRIALSELAGGRAITVYGQQEVVKDLIAARRRRRRAALRGGGHGDRPRAGVDPLGDGDELRCAIVAGCDGFHGVSRAAGAAHAVVYEHEYPFAWLGILARAAPSSEELIYTHHDRGFALHSMRSPEVTRLYLQVAPDEQTFEDWPDERIWEELQTRMALADGGFALNEGEIFDKGITPMRSFVAEPMRHGRLFLAGDAAHIVPATGAKGLNLAVADVRVLARGLRAFFEDGDERCLDAYSDPPAPRLARAALLVVDDADAPPAHRRPVRGRLQRAQLDYVVRSRAAATSLAENYVGLELEDV